MGKKTLKKTPKKRPLSSPKRKAKKKITPPPRAAAAPNPIPPPPKKLRCLGVFINYQYKTCLALQRDETHVHALQVSMHDGLHLIKVPKVVFDQEYKLAEKSPVDRAAKIYAEFTQYLGATDEALEKLGQFTSLTSQEVAMAKKKADERKNPVVPASSAKGKAIAAKVKAKANGAAKKTGDKPQTASQLFQKLIMEGKLTDEQIFAQAKEQFGLNDKKRGYVKWYRNHLKKNGQNPPEAIVTA